MRTSVGFLLVTLALAGRPGAAADTGAALPQTESRPACAANASWLEAGAPAPNGPCQCYPGSDAAEHVVIMGQWQSDAQGCAAAASLCRKVINGDVSCDRGAPCNEVFSAPVSTCAYVTCNGVRCGYEISCTMSWGCRYCE
jgi:hypothetical protein